MSKLAIRSILATLLLAALTGLAYPLLLTMFSQGVMGGRADGSLVSRNGKVVGSELIGQQWEGPEWFHGRPSATAEPYDASASSGSNLGPLSQALADAIEERISAIRDLDGPFHPGMTAGDIPADLVTASGSGLDPHVSPEAARFQVPRVAAARSLPVEAVEKLVSQLTQGRSLGVLGQPRVNVLELNLALEDLIARE